MVELIEQSLENTSQNSPKVVDLIAQRVKTGSKPGKREDDYHLSVVVEGGAMRSAISAGGMAGIWALDGINAVDSIYSLSAASGISAYAISDQAKDALKLYWEDYCTRLHINPLRALIGKPIVNMEALRETLEDKRAINFDRYKEKGIDHHILLTDADEGSVVDLNHFENRSDLIDAIMFSMELPYATGADKKKYGMHLVDGTLVLGGLAVQSAVEGGATHVLSVLSSNGEYLKRNAVLEGVYANLLAVRHPKLAESYTGAFDKHNDALRMIRASQAGLEEVVMDAIHVSKSFYTQVGRFEGDSETVKSGVISGYNAAFEKLKPAGLERTNRVFDLLGHD